MANKLSALDTLKKLASKKTVENSPAAALTLQLQDPALAGAKRAGNVVRLGFDPSVTEKARETAELKAALDEAEAQYALAQTEMREYGAQKRELYNDTFKSDVTTVAVPYITEVPTGPEDESPTPGRETRYVSVVCTNRFVCQKDTLLNLKNSGLVSNGTFASLFVLEQTKKLRANAEELVRSLLGELGMTGEDLENAMNSLFDTEVKVSTVKDYERRVKEVDEATRALLAQCVKRVEPAIKT